MRCARVRERVHERVRVQQQQQQQQREINMKNALRAQVTSLLTEYSSGAGRVRVRAGEFTQQKQRQSVNNCNQRCTHVRVRVATCLRCHCDGVSDLQWS